MICIVWDIVLLKIEYFLNNYDIGILRVCKRAFYDNKYSLLKNKSQYIKFDYFYP